MVSVGGYYRYTDCVIKLRPTPRMLVRFNTPVAILLYDPWL
jgi:hypothetical protein